MFYFENINGYKVLKSDFGVKFGVNFGVNHCFTTKTTPSLDVERICGRTTQLVASPDRDEIEQTGTGGSIAKLSEHGVNSIEGWGRVIFQHSQKIISPQQTHSDHIEFVDERVEYPDTDGLIITQKNIPIALRFADCTPLIFYDTKQKIGAISHAGWRGTAQKIGQKTITKMGSNPKDIIAIIGPAIGVCCYEVSDEVRDKLLETVSDHSGLTQGQNVDLKRINARQLEEIGVAKIDICPYCTSCNNDLFYSYRKENGTTDRHYAMLML